jgi:hypothetical protein
MTWENVNKHNGIVRIGVESTFGTTASNMKALLNRADPPWPLAGKTQQMIARQDSLTSRRAYQTPVKGMKSGSPVALAVDVKPTSGRLNAAASPVAFSNASALSHQILWRAAMGGELTPAAGTTVDSYSAPDVTVASGHGTRFAVGQWFLYEATSGALSPHQVTAIATDVLTVQPPLPGTPANGEVIRNLYNYFLTEDDTTTFTVDHAPIEAGSNEAQSRGRGCVFSPEIGLTLGGVPMLTLTGTSADHDGFGDLSLSESPVSDDMAAPFALDVSTGNGGLWLASSLSSLPSASLITSLRLTVPRQWQDIPGAGGVSSLAARKEVAGPQQPIQVELTLRGGAAEVQAFASMTSRHLVLFGFSGTGTSGRAFLVHIPNAVPATPPTVQVDGELAFCRMVLTAQRNTLGTTDLAASNVVVAWG